MTAVADLPVVERLHFILGSLRTFVSARGFFVFGHNVALMCVFVNGRPAAASFSRAWSPP
ncbi:MAG: hypothetical protein JO326_10140 [Acetobacteraceae bacterium]|nr:hypothetical protein [Acetobacteraceae bacterium]